ncbi:hypothetical protein [Streptomyces sp. NPDC045369]|uniref:hypothetical protein n=1 Tax=Streptomyces sp. NPDC045369 TaxID=3155732 RepID=UPI0033D0543F
MERNFTAELRQAEREGARIVCSVAPCNGQDVEYAPQHRGDRRPWRIVGDPDHPFRYSSRECHAVGQSGGPWALARLLRA